MTPSSALQESRTSASLPGDLSPVLADNQDLPLAGYDTGCALDHFAAAAGMLPEEKVGSRAQFIEQVREFAHERNLGPLDPADEGTIKDIRSEQRLALIFDTQTKAASDFGYWKQGQDPDVLDEFPAQRFIRVVEVKSPRERHQQFEGAVRLKSDLAFWLSMNDPAFGGFGVPWGPWGFNSGMDVEDVDRAEAEALGLLVPGQKVEPVERELNDTLEAGIRSLDPDMVDWLQSKLGDQVKVSDGTARWKTAD